MTPIAFLEIMQRQYAFATLKDHILVNDNGRWILHLRCRRCKIRGVPFGWVSVMNCDPCLDARLEETA